MFGTKALELIQEFHRTKNVSLPPFNEHAVREVLQEVSTLHEQIVKDVDSGIMNSSNNYAGIRLRHAALERNKRCLLSYLYNRVLRIKLMRWQFGSILPGDEKKSLNEAEIVWFNLYNKNLATYMRSLGERKGLDLTQDLIPPKSLYIQVRCLKDYGELELDDRDVVVLQKNSTHFLSMSHCQHLIQQGILEHME